MEYSEPELIIPALRQLDMHPEGLSTTQLIHILEHELQPTGHDAQIITGRRDTYFSQKVRNLTGSHKTIERRGYVIIQDDRYHITDLGRSYLTEREPIYSSLKSQGFPRAQIEREAKRDYKDVIIEEGTTDVRSSKQRRRSAELRDAAIEEYQNPDGTISCAACGFEFSQKYGDRGRGFIEIHHTEPVHTLDRQGVRQQMSVAVRNVVPLCSNCHRMVHRNREHLLSMDELRALLRHE